MQKPSLFYGVILLFDLKVRWAGRWIPRQAEFAGDATGAVADGQFTSCWLPSGQLPLAMESLALAEKRPGPAPTNLSLVEQTARESCLASELPALELCRRMRKRLGVQESKNPSHLGTKEEAGTQSGNPLLQGRATSTAGRWASKKAR